MLAASVGALGRCVPTPPPSPPPHASVHDAPLQTAHRRHGAASDPSAHLFQQRTRGPVEPALVGPLSGTVLPAGVSSAFSARLAARQRLLVAAVPQKKVTTDTSAKEIDKRCPKT